MQTTRHRAWSLREQGLTWAQVAEQMGIKVPAAMNAQAWHNPNTCRDCKAAQVAT